MYVLVLQIINIVFLVGIAANSALYRIPSGKKGYEFFSENNKHDYDWFAF